jgi:thiaminase/transcriptional activator TenA
MLERTMNVDSVAGRFYAKSLPIWQKSHDHPFVRGMADGSLSDEKFRFYICQDYLYLIEYARLYGLAAVKANDLPIMEKFAALMHATLHVEMEHHRKYGEKIGITRHEMEQTEPSAVTLAYTGFMLRTAYKGSLAHVLAVLLPCTWSYWEMGKSLAASAQSLQHPHYREWILLYSSAEFGDLALTLIDQLNQVCEGLPDKEIAELETLFIQASKFEWQFWDMAWHGTMWGIEG